MEGGRKKTFPREVRGTADPSTSLGMTKGRAVLPLRFDAAEGEQQIGAVYWTWNGTSPRVM